MLIDVRFEVVLKLLLEVSLKEILKIRLEVKFEELLNTVVLNVHVHFGELHEVFPEVVLNVLIISDRLSGL